MATVFSVRAHAASKRFRLLLLTVEPLALRADIPEAPENNRANAALLSRLEKLLSCRVQILSGHKSKRKMLAADCDASRIVAAVRENMK
ncbi:MAG: DUF167 domain-containing protein [Candidatus Micrarchaeota archaeon]|nr:DUF167 domain-containing protein [Candidatus Micrarchaeota archaeon]